MKKSIVLSILLMLFTLSLTAGPARPGRIVYTQPDGTTIGIYLHGDEFGHWATNDAGTLMEQDEQGYWKEVSGDAPLLLSSLKKQAAAKRAAAQAMYKAKASQSANFGSPKIPVILVGFFDKKFSKTATEFNAMLNTPGYSGNDDIGSVYDYFNENSFGKFTPEFHVLGPVNVSQNMAYYGRNVNNVRGNDAQPESLLVDAAALLDKDVDFSEFDNDGDGTVEFVIFYFAGFDEAQGGAASSIWSHAYYLSASSYTSDSRTFDGVKLDSYFCTAELSGSSGTTQCHIGTTCHEFAHTLGLPDFYDTDEGTNGSAANMYDFDLMAGGSYNGNPMSTCPPYLNAEELLEVGWLDAIPELGTPGTVSLPAINFSGATSYSAYMTKTSVANEYFVYETRGGTRWDAYLPTGMMVYHVDRSTNRVSGSVTAASTWSSNMVNSYSAHPCCYVVPAPSPTQTTLYSGSAGNFFFPGIRSVSSYTPVAWNGEEIGFQLTNIKYNSSQRITTFNLSNSNTLGIWGTVTDSDGNPLEGVTVSLTARPSSSGPSKQLNAKGNSLMERVRMLLHPSKKHLQTIQRAAISTLVTDAEGYYSVELEAGSYLVTVSKEGYVSQSATVTVTSRFETQNFSLLREGEEVPSVIYAWPTDILTDDDEYIVGSSANSLTGQNLYPSSEMSRYAGKQIKEFTFYLYGDESTTYEGVNVIIDYDSERKATVAVSADDLAIGGYTTVDLRDQELFIPSGKDIYAGVGYSKGGYSYNSAYYSFGAFFKTEEDEEGNVSTYEWAEGWPYDGLVSEYNLTATSERYSWDVIFDFTITIGDYEAPDTGYNYISDPGNGVYTAGSRFEFNLVETTGSRKPAGEIVWYYDDEPINAASVTLTSGEHVVEARFTTQEGKSKVVELEINVQ